MLKYFCVRKLSLGYFVIFFSMRDTPTAVADVTASLGSTLMNGGAVAAAIPGGQVIGAGMAAVGAGIWVVSKGVKLFADNWQGGLWSTTKHIAKKAGEKIKKGWNKVKSFFGF